MKIKNNSQWTEEEIKELREEICDRINVFIMLEQKRVNREIDPDFYCELGRLNTILGEIWYNFTK